VGWYVFPEKGFLSKRIPSPRFVSERR
jgi:hypothetical protein